MKVLPRLIVMHGKDKGEDKPSRCTAAPVDPTLAHMALLLHGLPLCGGDLETRSER